MSLKDDLHMVEYYIDRNGLVDALCEWYLPDLSKDPVIEILKKEIEVATLALQARIKHLQNVDDYEN